MSFEGLRQIRQIRAARSAFIEISSAEGDGPSEATIAHVDQAVRSLAVDFADRAFQAIDPVIDSVSEMDFNLESYYWRPSQDIVDFVWMTVAGIRQEDALLQAISDLRLESTTHGYVFGSVYERIAHDPGIEAAIGLFRKVRDGDVEVDEPEDRQLMAFLNFMSRVRGNKPFLLGDQTPSASDLSRLALSFLPSNGGLNFSAVVEHDDGSIERKYFTKEEVLGWLRFLKLYLTAVKSTDAD